jgi:hypothetical protein
MVGGSVMNLGYGIDILEVCFNDSKTTNKKTRNSNATLQFKTSRSQFYHGANISSFKTDKSVAKNKNSIDRKSSIDQVRDVIINTSKARSR